MVRSVLLGGLWVVGVFAAENVTIPGPGQQELQPATPAVVAAQAPPVVPAQAQASPASPPQAPPTGPSLFGSLGSALDTAIWGWVPRLPSPAPASPPAPAPAPATVAGPSIWGTGGSALSWGLPSFGLTSAPRPSAVPPSQASAAAIAAGASMLTGLLTGIAAGVGGIVSIAGQAEGGAEAWEGWQPLGDLTELSEYEGLRESRGGGGMEGWEGAPVAPSIEAEPYVPGPTIVDRPLWQPKVGTPFQIILASPIQLGPIVNTSTRDAASKGSALKTPLLPGHVDIFDVDLWDNPTETVEKMHAVGKKVICYFSAGTSEDWRPDFDQFNATDMGANLPLWRGERWLDIRSKAVWKVMQKRIELASARGCDAIDPDNVDGYDNERGGGFKNPLTKSDAVTFVRKLSMEAKRYGMSTGLKNSAAIIRSVDDYIQFAVNEECAQLNECDAYRSLLYPTQGKIAKPVFHIEYVRVQAKTVSTATGTATPNSSTRPLRMIRRGFSANVGFNASIGEGEETAPPPMADDMFDISNRKWPNATTPMLRKQLCLGAPPSGVGSKMSTVIKEFNLSGWVMYCDGGTATTRTTGYKPQKGKSGGSPTGSGWGAAAWARYQTQSDPTGFVKPDFGPEGEMDTDPEKLDPDVLSIIVNGVGPAVLDDSVWNSDVGPIDPKDFDDSVGKRGAGKDWIGPKGFEEEVPEKKKAKRFFA